MAWPTRFVYQDLPKPGVFAQAEAVASAGAPIAALKEALGDGATVEHSIQHARKPRKAAAVPAVSQRQHAP